MERYYGFDLGDAESAVALLEGGDSRQPEILEVAGARSFITATARMMNGEVRIGESACYDTNAVERKLRFKSRFLTDPESSKDIRLFASGVLGEVFRGEDPAKTDAAFYIGCPAGWDKEARENYRKIFVSCGYPPLKIVSESRAAMIAACQSKHLQVGYDILSKPVLVVDIGSSTTDFAYVSSGQEIALQTAGEVRLGGGLMDELLLERAVAASRDRDAIRKVFEKSPAWKSYCEFAARRLKESYFADEEYWKTHECLKTVHIFSDRDLTLRLSMDGKTAGELLEGASPSLGGKSFAAVFRQSLSEIRTKLEHEEGAPLPELLFLTGGVSRMREIRDMCASAFPEAIAVTAAEPEFSVARGLAWSGQIDENVRQFRAEVKDLVDSQTVENIVATHVDDLYRKIVDALVEPILENAAMPVFDRWRRGDIDRLSDIDGELSKEIDRYLHTDEAQALLRKPVTEWLKPVAFALEEYTMPICVRHRVPYRSLSLTSYLALSDIEIHIDTKDVFALNQISWLMDAIISLIVGAICGGSGIALISSGISGILAGVIGSLLVLLLGREKMQEAFMNWKIPLSLRKLVTRRQIESRIGKMTDEIRENFYQSLETEKNDEISSRLVTELSGQIDSCLTHMAQIAEMPLG